MTRRIVVLLAVLFWAVFVFASVKMARAESLTPATAPFDWTFLIVVLVIAAIVGAVWWFNRKYPTLGTAITTDASVIWTALETRIAKVESTLTPTPAAPPAPPAPAGRNGVPGVMTISVVGDPKVDLPAINAQYFG